MRGYSIFVPFCFYPHDRVYVRGIVKAATRVIEKQQSLSQRRDIFQKIPATRHSENIVFQDYPSFRIYPTTAKLLVL